MQSTTKKTWSKRLRKLILFMGVGIVFLVIIAYFLENTIGKRIVSEVQSNLKTEMRVGDVNFSLIRSFPYAALDLRNVVIIGTDKNPMLRASILRFRINVWSIFDNPIRINAINIEDGALLLKINANGKSNYDIFKPSKDKNTKDDVAFLLEKAVFKKVVLGYQDNNSQQDLGITIKNATFKGGFSNTKFNLISQADLLCHGYTKGSSSYLVNKSISYKTDLQVDRVKNLYQINNFALDIERNKFDIQGKVLALKNANNLDLTFKATDCNIGTLLKIFPQPYLQGFESEGNFALRGTIRGMQSNNTQPNIKAEMSLRNGSVKSAKLTDVLEKVNMHATLNIDAQQSYLTIPEFKGYFGRQPIEMRLAMSNLKNPLIDFYLNGKVPLASTYKLLNNPNIADANGYIALQNIQINGLLEDMKKTATMPKVNMSGALVAENVVLQFKNENIAIPSGAFRFDNNAIAAEQILLEGAGSKMSFDGTFHNFLPVVLDDSLHKDATLDFRAGLHVDKVDLKRFTSIFQTPNNPSQVSNKKENTNTVNNATSKPLLSLLNGVFEAHIDEFTNDKIQGRHFNGIIGFEQESLLLKGDVETMEGKMSLNGRLSMHQSPNLSAIITCEHFDATTFFEQCDDFGQDVLKSNNVSGLLNAKFAIDAAWDKHWNILDKQLYVLAYLNIQNGYIKNVKMLENFSTYVKIEDLRNIKFTNMENWFEISNRNIRIPVMNIKSNALNMTISGKHSFDGNINYNFKINAANVIVSRFKKFNPKLEPQQDVERNGFLDLYFNIAGTSENYKVQMSKKIAKADFDESVKHKKEIQRKLEAVYQGKSIPFDSEDEEFINMEKSVVIPPSYKPRNVTSNHQQSSHRKTSDEDKYEYIDGF